MNCSETFVKSGLITIKVKESGHRARPETEQLKPAAIVKLENISLNQKRWQLNP